MLVAGALSARGRVQPGRAAGEPRDRVCGGCTRPGDLRWAVSSFVLVARTAGRALRGKAARMYERVLWAPVGSGGRYHGPQRAGRQPPPRGHARRAVGPSQTAAFSPLLLPLAVNLGKLAVSSSIKCGQSRLH